MKNFAAMPYLMAIILIILILVMIYAIRNRKQ